MADIDIFNPQISVLSYDLSGKTILVYGTNRVGKAQPIDTLIPTPEGEKELGLLKVGDYVFDKYGKPTKVIEIYEQGVLPNYKVILYDGRITYCNDEHLWAYFSSKDNINIKSLKEILSEGIATKIKNQKNGEIDYKFQIPVCEPVEYDEKEYSVDPYVIGCFIGNGCTTMDVLTFSSDDEETASEITRLIGGAKYKRCSDRNYNWNFEMNEKCYYDLDGNTVIDFQTANLFKVRVGT